MSVQFRISGNGPLFVFVIIIFLFLLLALHNNNAMKKGCATNAKAICNPTGFSNKHCPLQAYNSMAT